MREMVRRDHLPSLILWGPPGTGKTTIAEIVAREQQAAFEKLSAIDAGVKEIRDVISRARVNSRKGKRTVCFIDEIHRFNKAQQDALLGVVERGEVILIGATTENPSFEVNPALRSRCLIFRLYPLTDTELLAVVERALQIDVVLKGMQIGLEKPEALCALSGGDARMALSILEAATNLSLPHHPDKRIITVEMLENVIQQQSMRYDKTGEEHFDTISAFIKSLRGSDPDAALTWLAKMIRGGEDPLFIARRMIVFASEDIGNADPQALQIAIAVFQALERIGMPEGRIPLAQGAIYLASAPRSNAAYKAVDSALSWIDTRGNTAVPLHLRNAVTKDMRNEGYGAGYKYPHDFPAGFVSENYFPQGVSPRVQFYYPPESEAYIARRLQQFWPERYAELHSSDVAANLPPNIQKK